MDNEQDLRARLGTALDDLAPGPLPFDAVVRQGRMVVIRRRATAAAVALAIAAGRGAGPDVAEHAARSGTGHAALPRDRARAGSRIAAWPGRLGPRQPRQLAVLCPL